MHGVNLDTLGRRDPEVYGTQTLSQLEYRIHDWARELDLEAAFFQTNHEGEFCEYLHRVPETADAVLLNAGAWTHYSWAIRDALEVAAKPAVEVHISDVHSRDDWRSISVFDGLVAAAISGKGADGYREGLERAARGAGALTAAPESRAEMLAAGAAELGLDAVLVGDLVNPGDSGREAMADVSWLTGFRGTSGIALVGPEVRLFVTDFRYTEQAKAIPASFEVVEATAKLVAKVAGLLGGRVGIDETKISVDVHRQLAEEAPDGVELIAAEGLVEGLRRVKDEAEIAAIAEAARLCDEVYAHVEGLGLAGRTEREVALAAEARMRELGAEPSFASIVAAGPNGARPHAVPGDRTIESGEYVVVDMGALARRLLLRLHPNPRRRRARGRAARGLRARPRRAARRARRGARRGAPGATSTRSRAI